MIKVSVEFNTVEEAVEFLTRPKAFGTAVAQQLGREIPPAAQLADPFNLAKKAAEPAPAVAPTKRSRKPKPEAAPVTEPVVDTTASIDSCRAALEAHIDRVGLPSAIALLKEFGANRVGDLKPELYGAFVRKCRAAK